MTLPHPDIDAPDRPSIPDAPGPHLVLSGFMGSGKTTAGREVAARTGAPFIDTDDAVLAAARAAGAPFDSVGAVFASLGEPAFRRLEADVLVRALASPVPSVISAGGGALLDPQSRALALSTARVVTLTAPLATLLARTARPGQPRRPLLEGAPQPGRGADRGSRMEALLAERTAVYAETHATVVTDDSRAIEDIAASILHAWRAPALVVPLGARSYPVRFAGDAGAGAIVRDMLDALRPSSWFHVTDTTVEALWRAPFLRGAGARPLASVGLAPGERAKHLGAVDQVLRALVEAGADRSSVVVAHGGGVVSDIAGFAAAVLLRGVRWISVPTTLLSMADAAIGGKTGVDLGSAKNAAGAFHQPSGVVIDVRHVQTETPRAVASGLSEIAKAGAIADPDLVVLLERAAAMRAAGAAEPPLHDAAGSLQRDAAFLEAAVFRAASVKARIVSQDERETGPRALLNFGHTLGHALEAAGGFERWTHGEAVALGMAAALRAGCALGITSAPDAERLIALLRALGLPTDLPRADVEAALPFLSLDKKRRGATVRAVFLAEIGRAVLEEIPLADLARLFTDTAPPP